MLKYLYADQLHHYPKLRDSMFVDRADQFHDRLGWEVKVNDAGKEQDEYDALNPLYIIWQNADGCHGGSMRFLPTVGQTMVNDHFSHLTGGVRIESPLIWESTRFCLTRSAEPRVAAALMLGGGELGIGFHLKHAVGVFDTRMVRVYRRLGWAPTILGSQGEGRQAFSVGLWEFTTEARNRMSRKSGISLNLSKLWFDNAFGSEVIPLTATG